MPRIHTIQSNRFIAMLSVAILLLSGTANAYIDLAPTLSKIITDSKTISLVEVTSFDRAKHEVSLKEVRSLKGDPATQPTVHDVSEGEGTSIPRPILQWAAPGSQAVMFASRATSLVCIGQAWYQVRSAGTSGWKLSADRPDLPLAYYGSLSKLSQSVEQMLAGKDAVLTVVAFGVENEGASFDLALNRQSLPGLVRVQRIRANLSMPSTVASASANPSYFLGAGWVGEAEVPQLIERLKSSDALTRADAAEDLRTLGHKASSATQALTTLLSDATPRVRFVAAAALLQINPSDARPLQVLADGLNNTDAPVRAMAARLAGLSGAAAAPLASKLGALLKDSDESIRITAIQAISTLGKAASSAEPAVEPLLDDPVLAIDAADALGRIGVSAQPALKRLAKMLESDQPSFRWAAVRAMSQIGGPDAHPAVDFMITVLPKATEVEGYNMMIYLSLLGPVATDALPTLHNTAIKNPVLPTATEWAMAPEKNFPWLSGGRGGRGGRGGGPGGADGRGPSGPDGRGPGGPGGGPGAGGPGGPGGPGGGGFGIGAGGPGGGGMGGGDIFAFVYQSYVHELGDRLRPAAKVLATKIMDNTAGEVPAWGYDILTCGPEESLGVLVPHLADDDMAMRERATIALSYMGAAAKPAKPQLLAALQKSPSDREKRLIQWALSKVERE